MISSKVNEAICQVHDNVYRNGNACIYGDAIY